jgi:hypothetical protein
MNGIRDIQREILMKAIDLAESIDQLMDSKPAAIEDDSGARFFRDDAAKLRGYLETAVPMLACNVVLDRKLLRRLEDLNQPATTSATSAT